MIGSELTFPVELVKLKNVWFFCPESSRNLKEFYITDSSPTFTLIAIHHNSTVVA